MIQFLKIFVSILLFISFLPIQTQAQTIYVRVVRRDGALVSYSRIDPVVINTYQPKPTVINSDYYSQISYYCSIYGCNPDQLYRVMMCESSGNPNAYNPSGASGLFQFMPGTWNSFSRTSGLYGNIWNGSDQARLASWAFANGLSSHWVCK